MGSCRHGLGFRSSASNSSSQSNCLAAPTCRVMAYESALEGFRLGISIAAQFLAERAVNEGSELLREAEEQVRALPDDLA